VESAGPTVAEVSNHANYIVPDPEADAVEIPIIRATTTHALDRQRARSIQLDDILESEDEYFSSFDSPSASESSFPESLPPLRPLSALRWFLDPQEGSDVTSKLTSPNNEDKFSLRETDPLTRPVLRLPFSRPSSLSSSDNEWSARAKAFSQDIGSSPHSPYYHDMSWQSSKATFKPNGSAETVSGPPHIRAHVRSLPAPAPKTLSYGHTANGGDHEGGRSNERNGSGETESSGEGGGGSGNGDGGDRPTNFDRGNWQSGQGDDDWGDERRGRTRSTFSSESESDPEDSTDEYGKERRGGLRSTGAQQRSSSKSGRASSTDDDVPLARKIPTALSAQRTIRRQVKDEREARRRERAQQRGEGRPFRTREPARSPPRAQDAVQRAASNGSREATLSLRSHPAKWSAQRPFAVEDLTQKLLNVQASDSAPSAAGRPQAQAVANTSSSRDAFGEPRKIFNRPSSAQGRAEGVAVREANFPHKSDSRQVDGTQTTSPPSYHNPALAPPGRSITRGRHHSQNELRAAGPRAAQSMTDGGRSQVEWPVRARMSEGQARDNTRCVQSRSLVRSSAEMNGTTSAPQASQRLPMPTSPPQVLQRLPMPPLPSAIAPAPHTIPKSSTTPQRVFIGDKERFNVVEIGSSTSAQDVLDTVARQGSLNSLSGTGGFMVFEIAQDCGMGLSLLSPHYVRQL
jgi:hypothetical protein